MEENLNKQPNAHKIRKHWSKSHVFKLQVRHSKYMSPYLNLLLFITTS